MNVKPKIKLTCKSCQREFFVQPCHKNRKFCSFSCIKGEGVHIARIHKTCPTCKNTFKIPNNQSKRVYCSRVCANTRSTSPIEHRHCPTCNKTFEVKPRSPNQKFCSVQCWKNKNPKRFCQTCNKELTRKNKIYCSPLCQAEGRKKTRITISCIKCGKDISIPQNQRKRKKYCSQRCSNEHRFYSNEEKQIISEISDILKLDPITQHTFPWLRSRKNRSMYLDAFFPTLNLAIEYDGKQHRQFHVSYHKTFDKFLDLQERDRLKEKLLSKHEISLIRIQDNDPISKEFLTNLLHPYIKIS